MHSDEVKAARVRLDVHSRNADAQRALVGAKGSIAWGNDTPRVEDVRLILAALDEAEVTARKANIDHLSEFERRTVAEAHRDVLAAECRADRLFEEIDAYQGDSRDQHAVNHAWGRLKTARAATDAAGALDGPEGGSRG